MAELVQVPLGRLQPETLDAMLEDFASRDGTDYGSRELTLAEKVDSLRSQLQSGALLLVYDLASEHWDLLDREQAAGMSL